MEYKELIAKLRRADALKTMSEEEYDKKLCWQALTYKEPDYSDIQKQIHQLRTTVLK